MRILNPSLTATAHSEDGQMIVIFALLVVPLPVWNAAYRLFARRAARRAVADPHPGLAS